MANFTTMISFLSHHVPTFEYLTLTGEEEGNPNSTNTHINVYSENLKKNIPLSLNDQKVITSFKLMSSKMRKIVIEPFHDFMKSYNYELSILPTSTSQIIKESSSSVGELRENIPSRQRNFLDGLMEQVQQIYAEPTISKSTDKKQIVKQYQKVK